MKTLYKSRILLVFALTGILFSCKENKNGYSDEIETMQYPADDHSANDTLSTEKDTTGISGFSTTNKGDKGSSGMDDGATGQGSGPGESAKDGATDSGHLEKDSKENNTSQNKNTQRSKDDK